MLANHTNSALIHSQILRQYDHLRNKGAFLERFKQEGTDIEAQMNDARSKIQSLIELYEEATKMEFMSDCINNFEV